jgi:hypothetical protein
MAANNPGKGAGSAKADGGADKSAPSIETAAAEACAALESAATTAVHKLAEMSRGVQAAAFDETKAAAAAFENLLKARSLADAAQNYIDYFRSRADVGAARAKSAVAFVADAAREAMGPAEGGATK